MTISRALRTYPVLRLLWRQFSKCGSLAAGSLQEEPDLTKLGMACNVRTVRTYCAYVPYSAHPYRTSFCGLCQAIYDGSSSSSCELPAVIVSNTLLNKAQAGHICCFRPSTSWSAVQNSEQQVIMLLKRVLEFSILPCSDNATSIWLLLHSYTLV